MVVWTEKGTGKVSAGWLPLVVAFLVGVVATAALHSYVLNPGETQAKPPPGKPVKKPARTATRPPTGRQP
jgi:hypothetical protein